MTPEDKEAVVISRATYGLMGLAAVLAAVLVVLAIWLYYTLNESSQWADASAVAGIQPIRVIEGPGQGPAPLFDKPMGVAVGKDGRIYVSDTGNNRICVFRRDGQFLFEFGGFGVDKPLPGGTRTWRPGALNFPVGIDTDDDGNVYVADFRNDSIRVYDPDGNYLRSFPDNTVQVGKGSSGQEGTGIAVTDVSVDGEKVYATDRFQVFVFSLGGQLLSQYGRPGRGELEFDHPNGILVTDGGYAYVADSNNARVQAFSPDVRQLWSIGSTPPGPEPSSVEASGPFGLPRGMTALEDGTLVVADAFNFSLITIDREGRRVRSYGVRGSTPGTFDFPNDVATLGDVLVVADKGNNRVQLVKLVP